MDKFKLALCFPGQQKPSSGSTAAASPVSSCSPSGQPPTMVRAPARRVVSLHTLGKLSLASFAVGLFVGFTQKRRVNKLVKRPLRRWLTRYLKSRFRRWVSRLFRPPVRRWGSKLLKRLKNKG